VKRGRIDEVRPTELWHRGAGFRLLQDRDDLTIRTPRLLHGNLLESGYEKIPILATVLFRVNYPKNYRAADGWIKGADHITPAD
jgi:hypothetical protein